MTLGRIDMKLVSMEFSKGSMMSASGKTLQCVMVTPERAVLDTSAEMIVLPMFDGELGVQPQHSPLIGRLGSGEMRLTSGGIVKKFHLDGGFAQVNADVVTILTAKVRETT